MNIWIFLTNPSSPASHHGGRVTKVDPKPVSKIETSFQDMRLTLKYRFMTTYFQDNGITSMICHRNICSLNFVPTKFQLNKTTPHMRLLKFSSWKPQRFGRLTLTSLQEQQEISPWRLWEAPQWLTKSVAISPGDLVI